MITIYWYTVTGGAPSLTTNGPRGRKTNKYTSSRLANITHECYHNIAHSHRSLVFHCMCGCKNEERTAATYESRRWITCSGLCEVETSRRFIA